MPSGELTTAKGRWMRSGQYACCVVCGTTDRPHMARGHCERCYSNLRYHSNIETMKADRKRRREAVKANDPERYAAKRQKEEAWKAANPERYVTLKADWHRRTYSYKLPIGQVVFVERGEFACRGSVVRHVPDRRGKCCAVIVQVDGGDETLFGIKRWHLLHKRVPAGAKDLTEHVERRMRELRPAIAGMARKRALFGNEAEEFEAEAVVKVVRVLRSNPHASEAFLKVTAKNRMIEVGKSGARHRGANIEEICEPGDDRDSHTAELRTLIEKAFSYLDEDERTIVELTADGATAAEVADAMGMTTPAVKSKLYRLRDRMQNLLLEGA